MKSWEREYEIRLEEREKAQERINHLERENAESQARYQRLEAESQAEILRLKEEIAALKLAAQ